MPRTREWNEELVKLVRTLYGPGKKFKSPRALSFAIGRDPGAISKLEESGNATLEMVVNIARACDQSPVKFQIVAGWLSEEEVSSGGVSVEERSLLEKMRRLGQADQDMLSEILDRLLASNAASDGSRRVAEESQGYQVGPE